MTQERPGACTPARARDDVEAALHHGELVLHYQPQVDLTTQEVVTAEALIRWEHPEVGLLLPDDFLPAVTFNPLMHRISSWVIRTACQAAAGWPDIGVAVNVAPSDAARAELVATVRHALAEASLRPEQLTIEVTEHALITDLERATKNLKRLADDGVRISLDDFGTGYSSLLYLRELPIDEIKIDRTFTAGLLDNPDEEAIVDGLIRLALAVGAHVVAEGVESDEQARRLMHLGCHRAQGYLFGPPDKRLRQAPLTRFDAHQPRRRKSALAHQVSPAVRQLVVELLRDAPSLHTIAAVLNQRGYRTPRGARWSASTVGRLVSDLPANPLDDG